MNETHEKLQGLFNRIPRRHTPDNVREMYGLLDDYEDVLKDMEADERYGPGVTPLFASLDSVRAAVKKSNDPKGSKKTKDTLFGEAADDLKDQMESAMKL